MFEELLTCEVALLDALLGKLLHHLGFGGYAGVVGAGSPACVLALHASTTHEDVLYGVVEHVTHVEYAGDVRWRYDDGVWLSAVGLATEEFVVQPILIPLGFYFSWVVLCC